MSDDKSSPGESPLEMLRAMLAHTPQAKAIGADITRIEPPRVWGRTPYREDLVGDPETGLIAGGVITTFLDHISGAAVFSSLKEASSVATIDLRIDYMRAATPHKDVLAEAHCYKLGRNIAFVRAIAYDETPDDPVAQASAAFMINSNGRRKMGANLRKPKP